MSEFRLSFPACVIAGNNRLSSDDLLMLRTITFPGGIRTSDHALILLSLQNSCPKKCEQWNDFFIEALTDFIIHYSYPQGSLDEINTAWLLRMLSTDGVVNSPLELKLILHVIDVSANVPPSLSAFALDQLRLALSDDIGAYRLTRPIDRGGITRYDLDYVNRVLRAATGQGRTVLSPMEIDVLRQIDAASSPAANHPAWDELMGGLLMREEESPRTSRWLRISNDMLADDRTRP